MTLDAGLIVGDPSRSGKSWEISAPVGGTADASNARATRCLEQSSAV